MSCAVLTCCVKIAKVILTQTKLKLHITIIQIIAQPYTNSTNGLKLSLTSTAGEGFKLYTSNFQCFQYGNIDILQQPSTETNIATQVNI